MSVKIGFASITNSLLGEVAFGGALGGMAGAGVGAVFLAVLKAGEFKTGVLRGKSCSSHIADAVNIVGRASAGGFAIGGAMELVGRYALYKPLVDLTGCVWQRNSCSALDWVLPLIPLTVMGSVAAFVGCCCLIARASANGQGEVDVPDNRPAAPIASRWDQIRQRRGQESIAISQADD